ncbi:ATP-grasp domain-containing protein [Cognatiluteimonas lumbrici]|uniref:ATP-grasp domain-containing protein n=1 Tax=Cognatiluteimonas lumbrici TaxID=2559601 RepID=UPI00112E05DE|nr:transporter [Luteimonas lumbrici]
MPGPRIAILTPAKGVYEATWPVVLSRLESALSATGVEVVPTPWTDHVADAAGLAGFDLVLPLLTWGYHLDHARWLRACSTWQAAGIAMANPADVLAWNSDKRYLQRLADQGVAIPPTTWSEAVTADQVEALFDATGAGQVIVKPVVSGGAWKTQRLRRGDPLADLPEAAAMLQPYLPTIEREGETSLLYFGGRLSHAVNKRPAAGDFRIQLDFGGSYHAVPEPPAGAVALAERTLAAIGEPLLYARIDMLPDADGRWLLMEAELIEPDFFLGQDPAAGAGFAAALRARLGQGAGTAS